MNWKHYAGIAGILYFFLFSSSCGMLNNIGGSVPDGMTQEEYDHALAWYEHYRAVVLDEDSGLIYSATSMEPASDHSEWMGDQRNAGTLTDKGEVTVNAIQTIAFNIIFASDEMDGSYREVDLDNMADAEWTVIETLELDMEPVAYEIGIY